MLSMLSMVKKIKNIMDISVIVPVYNTAAWLPECIDSVLAVPSLELEIILIDDESTDNSRDIMHAYAAKHANITALSQTHGRQGKARNTGLAHATGKYVLFLDSDDRLHRDTLTAFHAQAETHEADFAVGIARSFSDRRTWVNEGYAAYLDNPGLTDLDRFPELLADPSSCNKLYRRDFLNKHDIRFPENTYCEDVFFSYKASLVASRVAVFPEIIHEYRGRAPGRSPSGTQTFTPDRIIQCAVVYKTCLEDYAHKKGTDLHTLLEERTVIRFMRFFRRMTTRPDGDSPIYPALQELLREVAVRPILQYAEEHALPFLMIREGCFRHAAATLHCPRNPFAVDDFLGFLAQNRPDVFQACTQWQEQTNQNKPGPGRVLQAEGSAPSLGAPALVSAYRLFIKRMLIQVGLHERLLTGFKRMNASRKAFQRLWKAEGKTGKIARFCAHMAARYALSITRTVLRPLVKRRVWLIAERGGRGMEDNGYAFFRYCQETAKQKDVYFVHDADVCPPDAAENKTRCVAKGSLRYLYLLCLAEAFLFTDREDDVCPYRVMRSSRRTIRTVFLTHGVTLYGPGVYLREIAQRFDRIIAVSEREKFQKSRDWAMPDDASVVVTGLPRFDALYACRPEREILFCLTWRKRLNRLRLEDFQASDYFQAIIAFLTDPRLSDLLEAQNMKLVVRFHFRMQPYAMLFDPFQTSRIVMNHADSAPPLLTSLQRARALITDYSSILWDMAYMQRPVLLYQFDKDAFLAERCLHGFSTREEEMHFAAVARNHTHLINFLDEMSKKDFVLNETQKANAKSFFTFHDANNCERVFDAVQALNAELSGCTRKQERAAFHADVVHTD